ncbi:hydrolase [Nocardia sp. NBC_01503]|uniref:hydrolase n=1 Tax=Nocardia sp. NBC_01503 TaxID=2975997 RepID=UPI002E7C0718|nr:hydrolase [Nocardia sp. NBC_01503]WTL32019.1 hydrolase [Nocardia sp. NBC_01503]
MSSTLLDPRTALVIIDLQRGVVGMPTLPHSSDVVVKNSVALARAFRAHDLPVVLVRVSFSADGVDAAPGRITNPMPKGVAYPEGWDEIIEELEVQPTDIRITKRQWGAFYGTELDLQLRRRGITEIVLTGISTSIGVESSARAAHEHGYHVVVVEDATADRDLASHEHATTKIFPRLGLVARTDQILEELQAR